MALTERMDAGGGFGLEELAGGCGVLREQLRDLELRERAERQCFGGDVEGGAGAEPGDRSAVFFAKGVIADLSLSDEHDAGGERRAVPVEVALTKPGQERDHRVPHEAVRLVEEDDQR